MNNENWTVEVRNGYKSIGVESEERYAWLCYRGHRVSCLGVKDKAEHYIGIGLADGINAVRATCPLIDAGIAATEAKLQAEEARRAALVSPEAEDGK